MFNDGAEVAVFAAVDVTGLYVNTNKNQKLQGEGLCLTINPLDTLDRHEVKTGFGTDKKHTLRIVKHKP